MLHCTEIAVSKLYIAMCHSVHDSMPPLIYDPYKLGCINLSSQVENNQIMVGPQLLLPQVLPLITFVTDNLLFLDIIHLPFVGLIVDFFNVQLSIYFRTHVAWVPVVWSVLYILTSIRVLGIPNAGHAS